MLHLYPAIKLNCQDQRGRIQFRLESLNFIISLMSRSQLWTEENILIRNNILCKSDTETCQRVLIFLGLGITCFIIGWFNFLIIVNKSKVFLMFFGSVTFISIIRSTFSQLRQDNYLVRSSPKMFSVGAGCFV